MQHRATNQDTAGDIGAAEVPPACMAARAAAVTERDEATWVSLLTGIGTVVLYWYRTSEGGTAMTYQIASEAQLRFEEMTTTRDRVYSATGPAGRLARTNRTTLRRHRRQA